MTESGVGIKNSPLPIPLKVTSSFGYRKNPTKDGYGNHKGTDFAAAQGTNILAVDSGTVWRIGWDADGYGHYVVLKHASYYTLYAHMNQASHMKSDQSVAAGTVIGYVGTTGSSTGYHLHFEIRLGTGNFWNDTEPVDAMPYLNGTATISEGYYDSNSSSDISTNTVAPLNLVSVVGKRIAESYPQPMIPFVKLWVGEELLSTDPPKPNIFMEITLTRLEDAGTTVNLSVFDDRWDYIERLFSQNPSNVRLQYGYAGNSGLVSPIYSLLLQNYSLEFNNTGVILHVQCTTQGVVDNMNPIDLQTDAYNPTEAVKAICRKLNYKVLDENFDDTLDVQREDPYNLIAEYPILYIMSVILPEAKTADGEIMRFYFDAEGVPHFTRKTYSSADHIRTYVYQKGYDSVVQSMEFDTKGIFGGTTAFSTASQSASSIFGTTSKEEESFNIVNTATVTESPGVATATSSNQSKVLVDGAGNTGNQINNKMYYSMKNAVLQSYEASVTILGDPTVSFLDNVIIVNMTEYGYLHHTSGRYMVKGMVDTISGGQMMTTLKLIRNGDIEEGVELLNPKVRVK